MSEVSANGKKPSFFDDLMDLVESVILSIFIVTLIFTFLFRIATVDGKSMMNTLMNKDRLIISHLFYEPKDGDVIVLNNDHSYIFGNRKDGQVIEKDGLDKKLVKRVIAVGGQTINIDFDNHKVYVDGKELNEPYIKEPTKDNYYSCDYPITVPKGYVFVMGDNRNDSTDSRDPRVGFVPESEILGKVVFRIYPFENLGKIK
jgi:signal peptidase I